MNPEKHPIRYQFPIPRIEEDFGPVKRDRAFIRRIEITTSEVRLHARKSSHFYWGAANHLSLHLLHKILQSTLRDPNSRWTYSDSSRNIFDISPADYELPLGRLSPLVPPPGNPQIVQFQLFFASLSIHFSGKDHESKLELCPLGSVNHLLKFDDEIHAILRIMEMRDCLGAWEATGIAASGDRPGEIYRLIGPNGEIVGENRAWFEQTDHQKPETEQ